MRKGNWMQTASGKQFWVLDPRPEEVDIEDIACGLVNNCRYVGQVRPENWFSVATHSRVIREELRRLGFGPRIQLRALLHDAPEAYTGDVIRPQKQMPQWAHYRKMEHAIMDAVCQRFDLPIGDCPQIIKDIDACCLLAERDQLMGPQPAPWDAYFDNYKPLKVKLVPQTPVAEYKLFMQAFEELYWHDRRA